MKNFIIAAILLKLAGGAYAADLNDLAVKAPELKISAAADRTAISPTSAADSAKAEAKPSGKWYGSNSRRARIHFTSYMLYAIPEDYTGPVSRILEDAAQLEIISGLLKLQVQHMYGVFTMHPYFTDHPGIPSGDYRLDMIDAEKVPGEPYAKIRYEYNDVAVFAKSIFDDGTRAIQFVLPKDPATIYGKGFPTPSSRKNRCTDDHYNTEGDFWYFWNPYQEGCPIRNEDLVTVQADIDPMNSTQETYPDYKKLYGDNGNGDLLEVSFLVGIDESFRSGDVGKNTFIEAFARLNMAGFTVTVDEPRHKRLSLRNGGRRISVDMNLADPSSADFAKLAVQGMKHADIFLYNGHSGLGAYMDPSRLIEDSGMRLSLPSDKYQVFYFNGCSTYAYYNSAYFGLKSTSSDPRGTSNLDIITTGIGSIFEVAPRADASFITSIAGGEQPSWQIIIDRIREAEGDLSALTHVNGDEDNPREP